MCESEHPVIGELRQALGELGCRELSPEEEEGLGHNWAHLNSIMAVRGLSEETWVEYAREWFRAMGKLEPVIARHGGVAEPLVNMDTGGLYIEVRHAGADYHALFQRRRSQRKPPSP